MTPADGLLPAPTESIPFPHHTITDAKQAFRNAIARYTLLEQAASTLIVDLPTLSPHQILLRSRQLSTMQRDLATQDDQLIAILTLAGPEILNNVFIKDYRHVLAKVMRLFDQIREQIAIIKKNNLPDSTTHRNLDTSCQD